MGTSLLAPHLYVLSFAFPASHLKWVISISIFHEICNINFFFSTDLEDIYHVYLLSVTFEFSLFFNIHLNIYYKWLWQNFRVYQMISGNRGKLMQSLFPPPSFLFLVSLNWIVISKQIYDFWIIFILGILSFMASLVAQRKRSCLPMQALQIRSLSQEDPLEEEMATHSSILDWTIPRQRSLVGYSP